MVGVLAVICCLQASSAGPGSSELQQTFSRGCRLYDEGEFAEAVQSFQSLVEAGVRSSAVYYNLGNSYFRLGEIGRAVVNYRRALVLSPRDDDIRANLELVRSMVGYRDTTSSTGLAALVEIPFKIFSPEEFELAFYTIVYVVALCFVVVLFSSGRLRQIMLRVLVTCIVLSILFFTLERSSRDRLNNTSEAVLVSGCPLRSGPGDAFEQLAQLPEGVEVKLKARSGLWLEVKLPTGEVGWVREQAVELL